MNISALSTYSQPDAPALKQKTAAKDFESLLIAQMMQSIRNEGSGWLGTGEDQAADAAFGMAENEFAKALSGSGGFGLSKMIEKGLTSPTAKQSLSDHQL